MPSHETCSAGGNHEFDDTPGDDWVNGEIMRSSRCSKCSEVCQNGMLARDGRYEYGDDAYAGCDAPSGAHVWAPTGHDFSSPDEYFEEKCGNCGRTRKEWHRHAYTTCTGPDGQEFHRHSA